MNEIRRDALNHSVYAMEGPERSIGSRKIYRYRLSNLDNIDSAHTAVTALMTQNPQLLLVNNMPTGQTLHDLISSCRYLVINGNALCLTNKPKAPKDIDLICQDVFFSEALIEEPIKCSRGHTFEKRFIAHWIQLSGNDSCPLGQHPVGPLDDDFILKKEISTKINAHASAHKTNTEANERLERLAEDNQKQINKVSSLLASAKPKKTTYLLEPSDQPTALAYYQIAQPAQLTHLANPNALSNLSLSQKVQLFKKISRETPISELNAAMDRIPLDQLQEVLIEVGFDQNKFKNLIEKIKLLIEEQNTNNDNQVSYFWNVVQGLESLATYFVPDHPPANAFEASMMLGPVQAVAMGLIYTFPWGILGLGAGGLAYQVYKSNSDKKPLDIPPATNLTLHPGTQKLYPLIGREDIIAKVFRQWSATGFKKHPLLIGEAGVGKSVILQEIARRIARSGDKLKIPDSLKKGYVYSCTAADLLPADPYEGTQKFQRFFNGIRSVKNEVVASIDEVHTFFNESYKDKFGNLMKPVLDTTSSGVPYMLFATTEKEYEEFMKNDESIERRFEPIFVDILDKKSTVATLKQQIMIDFPGLKYDPALLDYIYEKGNTLVALKKKSKQPSISKQILALSICKIKDVLNTPPSTSTLDKKNQEINDQIALLSKDLSVTEGEERIIATIKRLKLERDGIETTVNEETSKLQIFTKVVDKIIKSLERVFLFAQKKLMHDQLKQSEEKEFKFICHILIQELLLQKIELEKEFKIKSLSKDIIDEVVAEMEASR